VVLLTPSMFSLVPYYSCSDCDGGVFRDCGGGAIEVEVEVQWLVLVRREEKLCLLIQKFSGETLFTTILHAHLAPSFSHAYLALASAFNAPSSSAGW